MAPVSDNLYELFARCFPSDRKTVFMETLTGDRFAYADLESMTALYAGMLLELGVEPGDRVAVQVDKSPEAIILYLATLRAGAAFLPLNTAYTGPEMEYFLADSEPRVVVCRPEDEAVITPLAEAAGCTNTLTLDTDGSGSFSERASGANAIEGAVPREMGDLAAILYTSGTTGRSKGAMLTVENLWSNANTLCEAWGFTNGDMLLHALPIFHAHGLFVAIDCVLVSGSRMLFLPKFDAAEVIAALPRCSVMMGVPTFYTRLLAHPGFMAKNFEARRLFISGSAPLLAETWNEFHERTGHRILERYGMTETVMSSSNLLEGDDGRIPGSIGKPLPGVELRVVGEDGEELPAGQTGMLEVRGPNVFKGYWRMPEKTNAEFRPDGFFITGDMARADETGFLYLVGRSKDLIITGGYNVYPKEIEEELDAMDGIVESAVVGVPDADFGERVIAAVKPAGNPPAAEEIVARLKQRLAGYKVPKQVHFVDELPRNVMGKVQKNILRERYGS
jgi:malonyl-CoA/methylmalonyl-CoA synthetase